MSPIDLKDRIRGGLLGTLVGDALGVPVEFTGRSVRDLDMVTGKRGFGTWNHANGTRPSSRGRYRWAGCALPRKHSLLGVAR